MAQGLRRRRFYHKWDKSSWKDICDLGATAQAMCPSWVSLSSSILLAIFLILPSSSATAQSPPNCRTTHRWRFFAKETYNGHNKIIGTQDCPVEGCRTTIEIPLRPDSVSTTSNAVICFPHRNIGDCLEDVAIFGGCKYWKCQTESAGEKGSMLSNRGTHFLLSIWDPWNEQWRLGIDASIYTDPFVKYPIAGLHISRQLVPVCVPVTNRPVNNLQTPWLQYIQHTADLLFPTTKQNINQCFFCTSLSQPLLAAVPSNVWLHEPQGFLPTGKLQNIPLFNLSLSVCLIGPSSKSHPTCSRNITVTKPICVKHPALLWCSNNVTSSCVRPPLPGFCTPVLIVPQVYLYDPKELTSQLGGDQKRRELFIPLFIGLGLNAPLGATGVTGAGPRRNTPSGH